MLEPMFFHVQASYLVLPESTHMVLFLYGGV